MKHLKHFIRRSSLLTVAAMFSGVFVAQAITVPEQVSAAVITERRLHISNSASGLLDEGQGITYVFDFTIPGDESPVQSLAFQFCTSPLPDIDCNLPAGQDVEDITLDDQDGLTGWSLGTGTDEPTNSWSNGDSGSGGLVRLTRSEGTNVTDPTPVTLTFGDLTNPSDDNETFFVRIVAYTDGSWSNTRDQGSVAASTVPQIEIVARVQETLNFSVGANDENFDPENPEPPESPPPAMCTPLINPTISLGDEDGVLSFTTAYDAFSYFRLSTNALSGVTIYYAGTTLENAGLEIAPIGDTAAVSSPGNEQFGLALSDMNGAVSFEEVTATGPYDNGDGDINDPFDAEFAFDPNSINEPVEIASAPSAVPCDQGEIRYLGNIDVVTAPGVYRAFIGYIASPMY